MREARVKCVRWIVFAALLLAWRSEAVSATSVFAVTKLGTVYGSSDSAATWKPVAIPTLPAGIYGSWLGTDTAGNIYVAFFPGAVGKGSASGSGSNPGRVILQSNDGGQTWSSSPFPIELSEHLVMDPTVPGAIYGIASAGIVRSTDGGATFSSPAMSLGAIGIGADPQQPGVVYATAVQPDRSYAVLKSTDYGATWTSLASPAGKTIGWSAFDVAVDPHNSSNLYLPAAGGCPTGVTNCGLYHSSDGGKTWAPVNVAGTFYSVTFDGKSGAIYASGVQSAATQKTLTGQVIRSTDGGKTWTVLSNGFSTYAINVYLDPNVSSTMYAAPTTGTGGSDPGGVFVTSNGGTSWKLSPVAPASTAPNDIILAMGVIAGPPPPRPTVSVATTVSAASLQAGPVAAESIVIATGSHIATGTATGDYDQPPMTLAGTTINVTDSASVTRPAAIFSVSDTQATYQIPPGTAAGAATVTITAGDGATGSMQVQVAAVAPGLYTSNSAGLAKGYVVRISNGNTFVEDVYDIDPTGAVIARPITVSNGDQVYLIAYGTGFRAAGGDISATAGGVSVPILYAGPQGIRPGLDQFNILIPPQVATGGQQVVPIALTAAGQTANSVTITVQ